MVVGEGRLHALAETREPLRREEQRPFGDGTVAQGDEVVGGHGGLYGRSDLFGGEVIQRAERERATQYFKPHTTELVGVSMIFDGDDRFYNNIVSGEAGLRSYNHSKEAVWMSGNLFLDKAVPSRVEEKPQFDRTADPRFYIENDGDRVYLEMDLDQAWGDAGKRRLVTTKMLGKAKTTEQAYEDPDGSPVQIDTDFFGKPRNVDNPFPGPFELANSAEKLQVWPLSTE